VQPSRRVSWLPGRPMDADRDLRSAVLPLRDGVPWPPGQSVQPPGSPGSSCCGLACLSAPCHSVIPARRIKSAKYGLGSPLALRR
jgi:hypothetical protein